MKGKSIKKRTILSIDLKCFYASVECIDRQLDPFATSLVVADLERGKGTIILAISPYLKSLGLRSRQRVYELPKIPNLIFAKPRMARYIEKSAEVVSIYLDFVSEDDIHVYSIDEAFLDVTDYIDPSRSSAIKYARKIMDKIKAQTGLTVTCGIGENIFMAKACMDIEAKKRDDFLAYWTFDDIPLHLWPVSPLNKMWGIGYRLEKRLNDLGFYTIGEIANSNIEYLKSKLGVIGEEIYNHANGIDEARIDEVYIPESKSYSSGQVLFEDYTKMKGETVVKDMIDEVLARLRQEKMLTGRVHLYVGYSGSGGVTKGMRLQVPTDDPTIIKEAFLKLYNSFVREEAAIRKLGLSLSDITSDIYYQNDLFTDWKEVETRRKLTNVIDEIKKLYGDNAILSANSYREESTERKRNEQIGGHRK